MQFSHYIQRIIIMKKFKKIYIEITNVCNLLCSFCPGTTRKKYFMSVKEFEYIVEKVKSYTDYIFLHLMGEPLLHPDIAEILNIAEKIGINVNITTNGTMLGEKGDIIINSDSVHMISVSLHSFEANNSSVKFEKYISDVIDFSLKANERKKICSLRFWNDGGENKLNKEILKMLEAGFYLDYNIYDKIAVGKNITVKPLLYIELAQKFDWPDIDKKFEKEHCFCYGLRDHIGILCDGSVVPCCLDHNGDINLGNIFKSNLCDIIESEKAVRIYNGFTGRRAIEKLCRKCGYSSRFEK